MNILFLAPRLPLPADTGGKIRTLNILKQLARNVAVHLVCFSFENQDSQLADVLRKEGIGVTLVPMREPGIAEKIFGLLFNPRPYAIAKYDSPEMERAIRQLSRQQSFDAIHTDHLHMSHYLHLVPNIPCVLDEHNAEYLILKRCTEIEKNVFKKFLFADQTRKMFAFEKDHVEKFMHVLAVSPDDKKFLEDLAGTKPSVHVVPNGVDTGYFDPAALGPTKPEGPSTEKEEALVFTGSMDWLPNSDAIIYFTREILPLIRQKRPQVKFYVVGKGATPAVVQLSRNDPRIVVTGRVDDVRPFIAAARVFVVPIRVGGGTRLKILEAMAMQRAVVSTTVGAEGIAYTDGQDIVLADTPEVFSNQVLKLLDDPQRRRDIGQKARALVCRQYDWDVVGKLLKDIYTR